MELELDPSCEDSSSGPTMAWLSADTCWVTLWATELMASRVVGVSMGVSGMARALTRDSVVLPVLSCLLRTSCLAPLERPR